MHTHAVCWFCVNNRYLHLHLSRPYTCAFICPYLDHEVFTEAPAGLRALLPERAHVVFEAPQVLGEGHEEEGPQLEQEGVPGLLRPRRVLQGIGQHHAPWGGATVITYREGRLDQRGFLWSYFYVVVVYRGAMFSPVVLLVAEIAADFVHDGGPRQDVGLVLLLGIVGLHDDDNPVR